MQQVPFHCPCTWQRNGNGHTWHAKNVLDSLIEQNTAMAFGVRFQTICSAAQSSSNFAILHMRHGQDCAASSVHLIFKCLQQ